MNRGKLEELIKLVKELAEKEELSWFKDELIKNLKVPSNKFGGDTKLLTTNEYRLLIGYNKIEDIKTREQLKLDCSLMYRHRLGLVVVKRDYSNISVLNEEKSEMNFIQFCTHAHYQVELLINYFFNQKYKKPSFYYVFKGDYNPRNQIAIKYEDNYYFDGELTDFSGWNEELIKYPSIDIKLKVINGTFKLKRVDVLYFIKKIRNDFAHRESTSKNAQERKDHKKKLDELKKKLENKSNPKTKKNYTISDLLKKGGKFKKLYNEQKFIDNLQKQDYQRVIKSIENLKDTIIENLKI